MLSHEKGKRKTSAIVCGDLAAHQDYETLAGAVWAVSHVPTGLKLWRVPTLATAKSLIRDLLALPIDWGFTDPTKVEGKVKPALLKVCEAYGYKPGRRR